MNTLVIHPNDNSTLFLNRIYNNLENIDLITTTVSSSAICDAIRYHDRIYLLGHGTEYGLLSSNFDRFIINSKHVQFLRDKEVIGIWCNADIFAENLRYCLDTYPLNRIPNEFLLLNTMNTELTNFNYNSLYYY